MEEIRRAHMVELIKRGVVPLTDTAQIDGMLDHMTPQDRLPTLRQIEDACYRRGDDGALETIAQWRLERQSDR